MNRTPPKYPLRFFRWFCDPDYVEDIEGDLLERFEKRPSTLRFGIEVLKLFRPGIIRKLEGTRKLNYYDMLKHDLKIAFRNLKRQKSISFINISGLVLGLLVTLMIGLWVEDELSWDKDNENYDRVVRVMQKRVFNEDLAVTRAVPHPLATTLSKTYDDVFDHVVLSSFYYDVLITQGEDAVNMTGVLMQSAAPHVMSLEMISGSRNGLKEEAAILLSKSSALALFGDSDPMNQMVNMNDLGMIVRGVYEDIPRTSRFNGIGFIASLDFYLTNNDWMREKAEQADWDSNIYQIFATTAENVAIETTNEKIQTLINDHLPDGKKNEKNTVFLHPMKDWHLKSSWNNGVQSGGGIQYVRWFSLIGLLVLFLACINFMNLSTAQSIRRAKEVGIRKSLGSVRNQLVAQFMTESTLLVFLSFLVVTGISYLITPYFNHLTDKQISVPLDTWQYWGYGLGTVLVVGILSGSYPALYLSSFRPIHVLKGTYQSHLSASIFRKAMVVFQFTISIALIIGTMVITRQIEHAVNRPLGYDGEGTISIAGNSTKLLEDELMRSGAIVHLAESSNPLTETWMMNNDFSWVGKDPTYTPMVNTIYVTHDFGKTINWETVEGRDFDQAFSSDSSAVILNETAARTMGIENPVGMDIKWQGNTYKVIGMVKDLLLDSPFKNNKPTFYFFILEHFRSFTLIRLNDQLAKVEAINRVAEVYEKVHPNVPFEFEFIRDEHERKFRSINRISSLSGIFSSFAIIISCLGLFGLASFLVEQRTKEIGIRKVLGASVLTLWRLVSKEFVLLVLLSSLIAIPISIIALGNWLESYEYRIGLEWWVFVLAAMGALVLTITTVSLKSVGVAKLNPAKTLKDE
ncbi:FtsX-like permease family protein [Ekhidna sp.]